MIFWIIALILSSVFLGIYHSDRIEPKGLIARIISRIGEK